MSSFSTIDCAVRRTDGPTDGWMNGWTDKASYRVACLQLKKGGYAKSTQINGKDLQSTSLTNSNQAQQRIELLLVFQYGK